MLYLFELTLTDKESAAIYNNYEDETALSADFDTKFGQAIKSDAYNAELLVAFAQTGKIIAQGYTAKGNEYTLSPRLVWVNVTDGEETADQKKCTDAENLEAEFYIKRGSAKKNADIDAITLIGIDGKAVAISDYWARPVTE